MFSYLSLFVYLRPFNATAHGKVANFSKRDSTIARVKKLKHRVKPQGSCRVFLKPEGANKC